MKALLRRIISIGLLWQILLPVLLALTIAIVSIQAWTMRHIRVLVEDRLTTSLDANLAMLQFDLARLGSGWRLDGDRLLIGDTVLNSRNDIVDRVAQIAGGVATIFAGDVRVATTLRTENGGRAVGTTLAPGPARSATLDRGEAYRGTAMILGKEYVTIYQPLRDVNGKPAGVLFVGLPTAETRTVLAQAERQAFIITLVAIGLLGLLVTLLLHRALAPLVAMTRAMRHLADGDLAVAIPAIRRHDEVGAMAAALQVFKQNAEEHARLQHAQEDERARANEVKHTALAAMAERIESETTSSVDDLSKQTQLMVATADQLAASAEHAGVDAHSASEAADQALATSQTVAAAAEQLSSSIREIVDQVGRSTEVIGRAVHTGETAQATIATLTERVSQIGTVAGMISDIAAKTNLLALNATIEAARAGEAGKGFAVVASEVKALANQTAHSTEEINRHIGEVRSATDAAVKAVGEIEAGITDISQIATAIASAMEQQRAATAEIARTVAHTSDAAREVAARVASVSAESSQSGVQAQEVRKNLSGLADAAVALKHMVVRIVRSSTEDADRRQHSRVGVDLGARLALRGDAEARVVRVTDLSAHGAAVTGAPPLQPGIRGTLTIDGTAEAITFAVRSMDDTGGGGHAHLAFDVDASRIVQPLLSRGSSTLAAKRAA